MTSTVTPSATPTTSIPLTVSTNAPNHGGGGFSALALYAVIIVAVFAMLFSLFVTRRISVRRARKRFVLNRAEAQGLPTYHGTTSVSAPRLSYWSTGTPVSVPLPATTATYDPDHPQFPAAVLHREDVVLVPPAPPAYVEPPKYDLEARSGS